MEQLQELVDKFKGNAAVYARRLDTGDTLRAGSLGHRFSTGSAAKVCVLLAFADAVVRGELDASRRIGITAEYRDQRPGSGVLRFLDGGLSPTLHDCATLMMIVSDNVATDALLDTLGGPHAVNAALTRLGCRDVEVTSDTVWALPPAQFGHATPAGLAETWAQLSRPGPVGELCRVITWRNQQREGFGRFVPFSPDLPDFGLQSPLRLWSKAGSYPSVSCEGGLFETDAATWVLAVLADAVADWGNGAAADGPTLRAEVSRIVFDAWGGAS